MKVTLEVLIGIFVIGLPLGLTLAYFKRWIGKKRCKVDKCTGQSSNICVDALCPAHCLAFHGHDCRMMVVGQENVAVPTNRNINKVPKVS